MNYNSVDDYYKGKNATYVDDMLEYYIKMRAELVTVFEEVVPLIKEEPKLYVFMVPFVPKVYGLAIADGNCIAFDAKAVQLVFGKKYYDMEPRHKLDFIDPTEEDYV